MCSQYLLFIVVRKKGHLNNSKDLILTEIVNQPRIVPFKTLEGS